MNIESLAAEGLRELSKAVSAVLTQLDTEGDVTVSFDVAGLARLVGKLIPFDDLTVALQTALASYPGVGAIELDGGTIRIPVGHAAKPYLGEIARLARQFSSDQVD